MMAEMIVLGWDQKFLMSMPFVSFGTLYLETIRIRTRHRIEAMNDIRAASAEAKDYREYMKLLNDFAYPSHRKTL